MFASAREAIQHLQRQAASLLIYQSVLGGAIGQAFLNLLEALNAGESVNCLRAYGNWFIALATEQQSWQDYLITQILRADNPFTQKAQQLPFETLPLTLIAAARQDLRSLQSLYACSGEQVSQWVQEISGLSTAPIAWDHAANAQAERAVEIPKPPIWDTLKTIDDWTTIIPELTRYYREFGIGVFAQYRAFRWLAGHLMGIEYPDPIQIEQLVGYESQKEALRQNTEALLAGFSALHVLLYGSRGSGKSSLVKALLDEYGDRGLRLIEVSKTDLGDLVAIVDQLRGVPQKFIIFVDDLSFEEDEDSYKALKVVLEGNLTARPQNVVVYATSNRRHLIREFFGDRPRPSDADEIHSWDTVQEKLSFSDRFGLTLTFEPADQKTYLAIVRHLAKLDKVEIEAKDLEYRALQWATRHNGRSGRTARQFVDFLKSELEIAGKR